MVVAVSNDGTRLTRRPRTAENLLIAAITISALYAGSQLFIPLALAVLLAFVLTPAMLLLRRLRVPKVAAVIIVVGLLLGAFASLGSVITSQATSLIAGLPAYEQTLRDKLASLRHAGLASRTMDRAGETLKNLESELKPALPAESGRDLKSDQSGSGPIAVEVKEPPPTALQQLMSILHVLLSPLATTGVVLLFLVFILIEREGLRDRLIRILGIDDLERSTTALNDTARRLSKYLFVLTLLNASFGAVIAVGLWTIGVPSPALWGIIAALMRFVPFVGTVIAAALPLVLAAAVDPGWTMLGLTFGLYAISEPLMGHIIEPVVQGKTTGLSTLAILIATAFWTLLWGPLGLLLAVPLTLVLVSVGRHLEPMSFFNVLLGDDQALSASEKFYQRILSGDSDDAVSQAKVLIKDMSLSQYYDTIVRDALTSAARDAERNRFDDARLWEINATVQDVVLLLADDEELDGLAGRPVVACLGARSALDDAGAHIVASLLAQRGYAAKVIAPNDWRALAELSPRVICIGAFTGRYRLNHALRNAARVSRGAQVIGAWWSTDTATYVADPPSAQQAAMLVLSFESAASAVETAAEEAAIGTRISEAAA
jgi:predicted PurR-regulated permease PerM